MQALRNASFLARLVLAWFALSIGVAVAAPVVKPQPLELICSTAGALKLLVQGEDGGQATGLHTLDCPMCASLAGPPVQPQGLAHVLAQPAGAPHATAVARIVAFAAPPPARGPPASA